MASTISAISGTRIARKTNTESRVPALRDAKEIFERKNLAARAPGRKRTPIRSASGKENPILTTSVAIITTASIQATITIRDFFVTETKIADFGRKYNPETAFRGIQPAMRWIQQHGFTIYCRTFVSEIPQRINYPQKNKL